MYCIQIKCHLGKQHKIFSNKNSTLSALKLEFMGSWHIKATLSALKFEFMGSWHIKATLSVLKLEFMGSWHIKNTDVKGILQCSLFSLKIIHTFVIFYKYISLWLIFFFRNRRQIKTLLFAKIHLKLHFKVYILIGKHSFTVQNNFYMFPYLMTAGVFSLRDLPSSKNKKIFLNHVYYSNFNLKVCIVLNSPEFQDVYSYSTVQVTLDH